MYSFISYSYNIVIAILRFISIFPSLHRYSSWMSYHFFSGTIVAFFLLVTQIIGIKILGAETKPTDILPHNGMRMLVGKWSYHWNPHTHTSNATLTFNIYIYGIMEKMIHEGEVNSTLKTAQTKSFHQRYSVIYRHILSGVVWFS